MASPRKSKAPTQLGLGESVPPLPPAGAALVPPPALVEYPCGATQWICKRFDALVAELPGLTVGALPGLHAALELQDRQWLVARRLFGLMPMVPPSGYALDEMRVWTPEELASTLALKAGQVQQELQAVRGIWEAVRPKESAGVAAVDKPRGLFSDDELLKKYDLGRINFRDMAEMVAFLARVRDLAKLLEEKMTAGLARNLLMTELQLRRLDEQLTLSNTMAEEWRENMKMRAKLSSDYNDQLAKIDKLAPWAGAIAGKYSFSGALSEIALAYQKFYAEGDNALIDGIFTSTEVQVLCRRSVQAPEPQYRVGWVVFALEAKANLWNPAWRSQIPPTVLKTLDRAGKEAIKAAGQETGEVVPDLEKDGPLGEYPPLKTSGPLQPPKNA